MVVDFFNPKISPRCARAQVHRSCDKLERQFGGISVELGDVQRQMKELDASRHAVAELLKFAQHEADAIIPKIRVQVSCLGSGRRKGIWIAGLDLDLARCFKAFEVRQPSATLREVRA